MPPLTNLREFVTAFPDDAACRAHLASLRADSGFTCRACGGQKAWVVRTRGLLTCAACRRQVSTTSGTALDRSRLPLAAVFTAIWVVATTPGVNTTSLMIETGLTRRATAWLLLSKMRRAMLAALAEPLAGEVEVAEAWFGGPQDREEHRMQGNRALMALALVEARQGGRCRLVRIDDNTTPTLLAVITASVAPGALLRTDGHRGYDSLPRHGFGHERKPHTPGCEKRGDRATPYADEVISATKRWLVEIYQKPAREHLPAYFAEFAFRREVRDPATRFDTLLRLLAAAAPRTRDQMADGADLPPVLGARPVPMPRPARKPRRRPSTTTCRRRP